MVPGHLRPTVAIRPLAGGGEGPPLPWRLVLQGSDDAPPVEGRGRSVLDVVSASLPGRWLLLFVALYPLVAVWSLTNPMFASPDENLHMVRAQSIAHGDFSRPYTTDGLPVDAVECFSFQPEVPADCMVLEWGRDGAQAKAPMEGYPPLFHSVAAIPAIVFSGLDGAYIMRLWLGAVVVALAAWAGAIASRRGSGPWPLAGCFLAMTPMAVFTMSTVNPSGMSVAAAILVTTAVVTAYRAGSERHLWVAAAVGAAVLALTRRDGLAWLLVIALVLAPLAPWRALGDQLRGRSRRWWGTIAAFVAGLVVVSVVWGRTTFDRFYANWRDGGGENWWEVSRYIKAYLYQAVGVFGWLDAPIGDEAYLVAMIVAGGVVLLGLVGHDRRLAWSTAAGVALLLVTPVLFGMVRFPYLQGRYLLPVWAATLVVAGAAVGRTRLDRTLSTRLVSLVLALWLVVHGVAIVQNLRRYAVGRSGSWNFVFEAAWHPPKMSNLVAVVAMVIALAILGALAGVVFRAACRPAAPDDQPHQGSPEIADAG